LTIEAKKEDVKDEATDNYIHRGIAQRAFSKMFRLAEYMKVDDAQFVDGVLTVFLYREIPEADKARQILIKNQAKSLPKAAQA
jgi:molecular chaperone IbpA